MRKIWSNVKIVFCFDHHALASSHSVHTFSSNTANFFTEVLLHSNKTFPLLIFFVQMKGLSTFCKTK